MTASDINVSIQPPVWMITTVTHVPASLTTQGTTVKQVGSQGSYLCVEDRWVHGQGSYSCVWDKWVVRKVTCVWDRWVVRGVTYKWERFVVQRVTHAVAWFIPGYWPNGYPSLDHEAGIKGHKWKLITLTKYIPWQYNVCSSEIKQFDLRQTHQIFWETTYSHK